MSRFRSESDLCRDLIAAATAQGWVAYPETAGWDLVLVWPKSGEQLGIEAKLRPSLALAAQLASKNFRQEGPTWAAAALPECPPVRFQIVARGLGALVLFPPWANLHQDCEQQKAQRSHTVRLPLPPAPPRVEAGARSPRRADRWKAAGLRALARLEVRGAITAEELREFYAGSLPPGWFGGGWLVRIGFGSAGALYALAPGDVLPRRWPAEQPEAYAEALAIEHRIAEGAK